jgi:hypothetical protein
MEAHLVYGFVAAGRQGSAVLIAKRFISIASALSHAREGDRGQVDEPFSNHIVVRTAGTSAEERETRVGTM